MNAENQPLTVAALRALIECLPDDTPVCFTPDREDSITDLHVITHAAVDRLTVHWDWAGPEYEGRPYLLLNGHPQDIDEHGQLAPDHHRGRLMSHGTAPPLNPDALSDARQGARLSQDGLARAVGTTRQQVILYEQGAEHPEIGQLADLARACDVDVADLVTKSEFPAGLASLRVGAGLTMAAASTALRERVDPETGIATNRAALSYAERGRLPLSWRPPPARARMCEAMSTVYEADLDRVHAAWSTTFDVPAPASLPKQNAGAMEPPLASAATVLPDQPQRVCAAVDALLETLGGRSGIQRLADMASDQRAYQALCRLVNVVDQGRERHGEDALADVLALSAHRAPLGRRHPEGAAALRALQAEGALSLARRTSAWRPLSAWLWERLVQVAAAGPAGADDDWTGGARWQEHLATRERPRGRTGRGYVDDDTAGYYWLTEAGRDHIIAYRDDYAVLYPQVRQPRTVREMTTDTLLRVEDREAYTARLVWGTTRPASRRWTIRARVRTLAGGIIPVVVHGIEGYVPSVLRWHRDDDTGSVRPPRVDEVVEVISWTSPWRSMPNVAPDLPGVNSAPARGAVELLFDHEADVDNTTLTF